MLGEIIESGGRIDRIYYCADMEGPNRKPDPGMGLQAIKDFPEIDPAKSIMIGNSLSDMRFGRNLGVALTIFLTTTHREVPEDSGDIDLVFKDLISVAKSL
jgi:histidinol phosphatase-like enzyme